MPRAEEAMLRYLAGAALVLAVGCGGGGGDDDERDPSITFELDGVPCTYAHTPVGGYVVDFGATVAAAYLNDLNEYPMIDMLVPGRTTGSFGDVDGALLLWNDDLDNSHTSMDVGGSFTVQVTAYGPVGGRIEGTFDGVVSDGSHTHAITNGAFSVIRAPDM